MHSTKKRKRQIICSDDEECPSNNNYNDDEVQVKRKSNDKNRIRKINLGDSEDDCDETADISINDIKKKAKLQAKKLIQGDSVEKVTKSNDTSKTPPSAKKNNILNYFKPLSATKKPENNVNKIETNLNNDSARKEIEKPKISSEFIETKFEDNKFTVIKEKTKDLPKKSESNFVSNDKVLNKIVPETKHETKTQNINASKVSIKTENFESKEKIKKLSPVKKPVTSKPKSPKKPFVPCEALPRIVETKRISDLWVDKYKPSSCKQVIGQQGDRSSLNKLFKWLKDWHKNLDKKPSFGKWGSDDGAGFKAALLSGPPGIGKTTSAQLVCKELGYDFLELNASDTRNKKSLQEDVRELLRNTKLTDFFKTSSKEANQKLTAKHCVIMDEVDGMAGNEDRGGVAELIQLIKGTHVPIICICNDRGDQKMRSLVNYCFDLKFTKPKLEQIKATLLSIAYREKLSISPNVLTDLIVSSNYDIRQCIHNLSLLGAGHTKVANMVNQNEKPIKDVKLGPFDAIKKVFATGEEYARMSFIDKSDLFFCDYSIMPLFVYENYISVNLSSKESSVTKQLKRLCKSIDSISLSDTIEKEIRTNQNWSLLPLQAAFSTVAPGTYMRSSNGLGFPQFPQFMGKLSTTNKNNRIIDELMSHMMLSVTSSRTSLALDYIEPLQKQLVEPLVMSDKGGVSSVLDVLENYSLTKEDMDSILEIALWNGDSDPFKKVDSKTKSALTRAYNKKDFALPYATENDTRVVSKKGKGSAKNKKLSKLLDKEDDEEDIENDDNMEMDFY